MARRSQASSKAAKRRLRPVAWRERHPGARRTEWRASSGRLVALRKGDVRSHPSAEERIAALERTVHRLIADVQRLQRIEKEPGPPVVDPVLAWSADHGAELARFAGRYVAIDPARGVVADDNDYGELMRRLDQMGEEGVSIDFVRRYPLARR